jgi:hypothetical protein
MEYIEPSNNEKITFVHLVKKTEVLAKVTAAYVSAGLSGHDGEWEITDVTIAGNDTNLIEIFSHAQLQDMEEAAAAIYVNNRHTQWAANAERLAAVENTPSTPPKGLYPPSTYIPE